MCPAVESGYVRVIRRRWAVILVCLVVGVGTALAIAFTQTKQYQAKSELLVHVVGGTTSPDAYDAEQLSAALIPSFQYLAESKAVAQLAQSQLGLGYLPKFTATPVASTLLIDTSTTAGSPAQARAILSAGNTAFIEALRNFNAGHSMTVQVGTVDEPTASSAPVSPRKTLDLVYGAASGLVIGFIIGALMEAFDRSSKATAEPEAAEPEAAEPEAAEPEPPPRRPRTRKATAPAS